MSSKLQTWRAALVWSLVPLACFGVAVLGSGRVADVAWVLFFVCTAVLILIGVRDSIAGAEELSDRDSL
ncbi:MAG: hypothetical protein AB7I19_06200 [Planctomycetota bacterium]